MIRKKNGLLKASILAGLIVSVTACNGINDQQSLEPSVKDSAQASASEQSVVALPMNLNRQIEVSKDDLAQRLGVSLETVELSGARQVTWRSGALGCPEPGKSYTEALVPGAVIYLQVNNTIHAYHAKFAGQPFYCPRERVEPPVLGDDAGLT